MILKNWKKKLHNLKPPKKRSNGESNSVLIKSVCVVVLLLMVLSAVYSMIIADVKELQENTVNAVKEEQFDKIYNYLVILQEEARESSTTVAKKVEKDINETVDLDQLKSDMDNHRFNKQLNDVLEKDTDGVYLNNINTSKNGIIVCDTNGILLDRSYDRAERKDNSAILTPASNYNKELANDAIYHIMNHHTSELIAVEQVHDESELPENHIKISEVSYNTLKKVFMAEGLEGLRHYQFLVPAYITETGDVFGQQDIIMGVKNDTHKIIVIQEYNLIDQIEAKYPDIIDDSNLHLLVEQFLRTLNLLYVIGIGFIIDIIALLVYISIIYNQHVDHMGEISHCECPECSFRRTETSETSDKS